MSKVWSCVVKMTELYLDTKESKINQSIYIYRLKKENIKLESEKNELNKKYQVKTSDPVTNDVIDRIFVRHQQGMEKFKVTMAQNSKTIPQWIEEVIEEQIDSISYLSTLKDRVVEREEKLLKDIDILRDELTINNLLSDKKDEQIDMLLSLGLSTKEIRNLKYEKDRVEKIMELESKDKKQ